MALETKEKELEEIEANLRALREEKETISTKNRGLREVKAIYGKVEELEKRLMDWRNRLPEEYKGIELVELDNLIEDMKDLVDKARRYESFLSSIMRARQLRDEIERIKSEIKAITGGLSIEELDNQVSTLNSAISARLADRKRLEKSIEELSQARDKCPVCGSVLTEEHRERLMKRYRDEMEELTKTISSLERAYKDSKKRLDRAREKDAHLRRVEGEYNNHIKWISVEYGDIITEALPNKRGVEEVLDELDGVPKLLLRKLLQDASELGISLDISNISRIENLVSYIQNRMSEIKKVRTEMESYLKEVGELNNMRNILESKMSEVGISRDELESLDEMIREHESRLKEIEDSINRDEKRRRELSGEIGVLRSKIEDLREMYAKYEEYVRKKELLEKIKSEIEVLDALNDIFADRGFPKYFVNNVFIPHLERRVNIYLESLSSQFRLRFEPTEHGIKVEVLEAGKFRDIHTLSGGESTVIGLAFRLGLGEVISQLGGKSYTLDFMIFDEAFPHLDREKKNAVLEVIDELIKNNVLSQVIVITHDFEIRSSQVFKSVVEVYREGEVSRLRVVEAV